MAASTPSSLQNIIADAMAILLACLVLLAGSSSAQLSANFYSETCPDLLGTVRSVVESAVSNEKRMGASLVRLFFHDCFVNGCDGSILLDDTSSFQSEKNAGPNRNSARGFQVIDQIKSNVEKVCPGIVSCADIVALAARDSVNILGGPDWQVKLGRRDSRTASLSAVNTGIPSPASNFNTLNSRFGALGLSTTDLVALSGGHTIGQARCVLFRGRVYNDTNIDGEFARSSQATCPRSAGSGDNNLSPLDLTPADFDNGYYKNLVGQKGLLHSDQELFNTNAPTNSLVQKYSNDVRAFHSDFATAMIKMGDINPLTGNNGEIRKDCTRPN